MPARAYLVASGGDGILKEMCARVVRDLGKERPTVAVSYAPVEGDRQGLAFMSGRMGALFPGARLEAIEHDRAVVERADLVFVSGGDPVHGARVLARTGAAGWMREAAARGVPHVGVSAGAILLGEYWVDWPEDEGAPVEQAGLIACVGVVTGHVFDCHDEDDGWGELRAAAQLLRRDGKTAELLGIPTRGGLVFQPDGTMEVVGMPPFRLG